MRKLIVATTLVLASTSAAAAGMGDLSDLPETRAEGEADFRGLIGIGALSRPEYIGSDDNETVAVPLINLDYKDTLYFKFNRAGVWFWKPADTGFRFGALLKPRRGWDDSDGNRLRGMGERDDSIEAGLNVAWHSGPLQIEGGYLTDISDESDGDSAYIDFRYAFIQAPKWRLTGKLGFEYLDDDVTDYYFGVPGSKAIPGRPKYSPDEAWNTSVGLVASYSMTKSWALLAAASYHLLGDEIDDSPIVEDDDYITALIGVGWQF